ncbi:hypothetical protein CQ009_23225 [Pseudomonas sp. MYb2]|uniref:hypothetical protein n=1 Tax=unclassified Pseudomonas TaxID=196821 RepID=UPI000CFEBFF2|nr:MULTISPECIES: hypothetical protein [unclassified Pseudomonas]PRB44784.1 hypothetical protein CQ025_24390 [Pseudomonas sp. MYb3]PRC30258.1 hypothetical protein CQ009_23225 [Pseudomonas sp. MYb2]
MITIRSTQMDALQRERYLKYARRLVPEVQNSCSVMVQAETENTLLEKILLNLQQAEQYGLFEDRHTKVFVECCFLLGADFHLQPDINKVLNSEGLTADMKVFQMLKKIDASFI